MKRWKQTVLPLLAVLLLLTGCGGAAETVETSGVTAETQVTDAQETSGADENKSVDTETQEILTEALPETESETPDDDTQPAAVPETISLADIPAYSGEPYIAVNDNEPSFTEEELRQTASWESYSELDALGRCGTAMANIGQDLMPTEKRGSISQVKPTGWHSVEYDFISGDSLYNRCHLIGYQLTAENANERNLITGTRYLNVEGMLPFEDMVADYIKETGNHVLYRVTPVFEGNNLVASGVQMEARSLEDDGDGICFNIYAYNVQPGVAIDYATGESQADGTYAADTVPESEAPTPAQPTEERPVASEETEKKADTHDYVLNTNTYKFHLPSCSSVDQMSNENRLDYNGTRDEVISKGYEPCKRCNP